ncbi:hypothetical protein GXW83_24070 [Streptacidiphilus sp. PB12-B1b]|uniref:hypothetical protein n=1 Tax=Streptacidiphilus sp. PB12-B1b TaxID=2705012 RepID=UPI0015FD4F56|nr:hypothetical protein [Streptacidiphilus sp. PB12-B1b]QMU78326.1 hypothetical protein GXW83_24070 [Streptacidiphilus sp. PB12-B1b]
MLAGAVCGCRDEAEVLAELAESASDESAFRRLASAARAVAQRPDLGSVGTERELDAISVTLRSALLRRAHRFADPHFRSPGYGPDRLLPSGEGVGYIYERGALATGLEARIGASAPVPVGWSADHVAFSSGMAAISATLQCYRAITRPTAVAPLRIGVWAAYYETDILLELSRGEAFVPKKTPDLYLAAAGGEHEVLYIEPVRYDWDLTPMDLASFARAWRSRPDGTTRAILLDTTLSSCSWSTADFLEAVADDRPLVVVELRSGLKFDQQGLELANVGLASVYSRHEERASLPAGLFGQYLRVARSVSGSGLSMDALAVLDHAFVFDPQWTRRHSDKVFVNNRRLASVIADGGGGVFARVGHPSLAAKGSLRDAPFVMCRLAEDSPTNHAFLLGVVRDLVDRERLPMVRGASFGFRAHRWEVILPKGERGGLFKVAMGARSGPSAEALFALFGRLAAFRDFAALRRAHPGIRAGNIGVETSYCHSGKTE